MTTPLILVETPRFVVWQIFIVKCNKNVINLIFQVGTLNFMAPEALDIPMQDSKNKTGVKLARSSDVWSLGCILYQMVYGHPPFHKLSLFQKLKTIINPNYKIAYPKLSQVNMA